MFGYIQDAKTLGTIFINGLAYTLTNAATSVYLKVLLDGKEMIPTSDDLFNIHYIKLPGLRYGQTSDLLFNVKGMSKKKLGVIISCVHKGKKEFP